MGGWGLRNGKRHCKKGPPQEYAGTRGSCEHSLGDVTGQGLGHFGMMTSHTPRDVSRESWDTEERESWSEWNKATSRWPSCQAVVWCVRCGVRLFFSQRKNQLRELTEALEALLEGGLCVLVLAESLAGGPAESPHSLEDNGVRFGLDYTRPG